jgi:UrcA family protein
MGARRIIRRFSPTFQRYSAARPQLDRRARSWNRRADGTFGRLVSQSVETFQMERTMTRIPKIASAILAATILAGGAPLLAQQAAEEIVVLGTYGQAPDSARTLSQAVSYADLDLSTSAGKAEMRRRLNLTARFLCDKLGESGSSTGPTPSCRDAATKDAMSRLGTLEEQAAPRGTTWVAGTAWEAPYPADWATRYP